MRGNRIARFDPGTQRIQEWELPKGAHPQWCHGRSRRRYHTSNGNRRYRPPLDPKTGKITEYRITGGDPHTLVIDGKGYNLVHDAVGATGLARPVDGGRSPSTSPPATRPRRDARGNVWFAG